MMRNLIKIKITINSNLKMDPTKPILDLYNESYYSNSNHQQPQSQNYKSSHVSYNERSKQSHNHSSNYRTGNVELQDKYQELYEAYQNKLSKLNMYEQDQQGLKNQNLRLREEIDRLTGKNQQLNAALLSKNLQLQQVYRKLQQQMRGGSSAVRNRNANSNIDNGAIDRLEDGLRQAISSNYQILRESALAELKQFMH